MTRDELTAIAGKTDAELAALSVYETKAIEAHVQQANAADAKVEALSKDHTAALKAASEQHTAALAAKDAEKLKAVQDAVEAVRAKANDRYDKFFQAANKDHNDLYAKLTATQESAASVLAEHKALAQVHEALVTTYLGDKIRREREIERRESELAKLKAGE